MKTEKDELVPSSFNIVAFILIIIIKMLQVSPIHHNFTEGISSFPFKLLQLARRSSSSKVVGYAC